MFWPVILTIVFADETADQLLLKVANRLQGFDRSMIVESNVIKKGKIKKSQEFNISLHWPTNQSITKMTLIEFIKPKRKSGVKYWEHIFSKENLVKKWITMPVTGKLKDITKKSPKTNDFDFSELQLTSKIISNHNNTIIQNDELQSKNLVVIEAISKNGRKKKLLYVDNSLFLIQKVETFNKKNKMLKSITCDKFEMINKFKIATQISIDDFKKKHTVDIKIKNFQFTEFPDITIFNPRGK